ncbi:hypothetical protein Ahy_A03g012397 isoform B [Arachis hypogaea]|uniref:CCHC-type domain-containing protein n=1 Tax=Arachis hypogaea TaxID=3818 RepID=A0A445DTG6_ARAHY|nr:hypothetical protein Ahy_A03g012397 isoform B [Arachis hypogaea]
MEKNATSSTSPTPVKPKPGRPTKKRRRDKEEQPSGSKTKMRKKYNPIRCMYCGEVGHNKRGCAKKKRLWMLRNMPSRCSYNWQLLPLDQLFGRLAKLQVIKRKARLTSSPKHVVTGSVAVSAETIKGTSSGTAKRLKKFMTFVPTLGFKAPRKTDDKV